jgi:hypothetical protein
MQTEDSSGRELIEALEGPAASCRCVKPNLAVEWKQSGHLVLGYGPRNPSRVSSCLRASLNALLLDFFLGLICGSYTSCRPQEAAATGARDDGTLLDQWRQTNCPAMPWGQVSKVGTYFQPVRCLLLDEPAVRLELGPRSLGVSL